MAYGPVEAAQKGKGGLHKSLGVPQGQPIPPKKMASAKKKASPGSKLQKELTLADTLAKIRG